VDVLIVGGTRFVGYLLTWRPPDNYRHRPAERALARLTGSRGRA